jgi:CubicO group peptidase (beta-lactamase class C family)
MSMTLRPCAALALLAIARTAQGQALPARADVNRIADSLARDFLASNNAPSAAIAVVRGADTLLMSAWGTTDREKNTAATSATIYRVGSVTKQFTASAIMQFVEQHKVVLDSTIGSYLPALPVAWKRVTVRQLLNHTSGIPSYTDIGQAWASRWAEDMTPETLVSLTAKDTMWFAPGASWKYDNSGYVVLGMLVERIAGRPWSTDVIERFAKPLHLADTRVCDSRPTDPRAATGYTRSGASWQPAPYISMTQPYAAGSICSTVGDLARWNRALATGQVVSPASYVTMTTPTGAAQSSSYGFGLTRQMLGGHTVVAHGGSVHGFITANAWIADAELSITVLTNGASARAEQLLQQLARASLGIPLLAGPTRVTLTSDERAQYVGVYALALPTGARDFTFTDQNGVIYAQLAGQGANPIIPYGNHVFGAEFDPSLRITFTVENGRATKLVLAQGGNRLEAPRK